MDQQEYGRDKVKKICDALKAETLDPAKREAQRVVGDAEAKAKQIIDEGRAKADALIAEAKKAIEQEKQTAEAALKLAARQSLESLKQMIEKDLFNKELLALIGGELSKSEIVVKFVETIVNAIQEEGIEANLEAHIPKALPADEINKALSRAVVERLKDQSVTLSEIGGGAEVKLIDDHITLDLSDDALHELLARYMRDDLRKLVFQA